MICFYYLIGLFFLSGNLLGLGGLVQGGVGRVEWRIGLARPGAISLPEIGYANYSGFFGQ